MGGDHLLERHETRAVGQRDVARQQRWDLDAGEAHLVAHRVTDHDRQVEREVRDIGKRMRRIDGQRRKDGEDAGMKLCGQEVAIGLVELGDRGDGDTLLLEGGRHPVGEKVRAALEQTPRPPVNRPQLLAGGHTVR